MIFSDLVPNKSVPKVQNPRMQEILSLLWPQPPQSRFPKIYKKRNIYSGSFQTIALCSDFWQAVINLHNTVFIKLTVGHIFNLKHQFDIFAHL